MLVGFWYTGWHKQGLGERERLQDLGAYGTNVIDITDCSQEEAWSFRGRI